MAHRRQGPHLASIAPSAKLGVAVHCQVRVNERAPLTAPFRGRTNPEPFGFGPRTALPSPAV